MNQLRILAINFHSNQRNEDTNNKRRVKKNKRCLALNNPGIIICKYDNFVEAERDKEGRICTLKINDRDSDEKMIIKNRR